MKKKLLSFFLLLSAISTQAQLIISPGGGAATVSSSVGGPGLTISNVSINCDAGAYGAFTGGAASGMGISNGLMLSTGSVTTLPGSGNVNDDFSFCVGTSGSDPQLTALSSSANVDPCIIEFDVVPQCNNISITFVFGSDEYTNWVNQTFNDAFGFFVSGPNPGGGSYSNQNIAVLPSGTNVSVDNVNQLTNTAFFVNNNAGGSANHFDGFTTVLTPSIAVTPCQTYHFKLAIADATDCAMDSGVLIDLIQCVNVMSLTSSNTPATACGVNNGTAGVTVSNGFGPFTYTWSPAPGAGQGTANATGLTAGTTYTVTVDDVYACILPVSTTVTIGGPTAPTVAVNSTSICNGASATLTGSPSAGGGTFSWAPGGQTTNSITVSPSSATTYTCTYTLSGCTGSSTGTVTVNPQPNVTSQAPVCSGLAAFNLTTDVAGGTWSGTGITNASAGTFTPSSASLGNNVITYTAPGGCTDTIQIMVTATANAGWTPPSLCVMDAAVNLDAFITGSSGGTWSGTGVTGNMFDPAGLVGSNSVTFSVGAGSCAATSTLTITVSPSVPPTITAVGPQCADVAAFNLSADIPGGTWSGTGITNASAGTFNPSSATVGTNQIIYSVTGSCAGSDTIDIMINAVSSANWTLPATMCANNGAISLDSLVTGSAGGTWSGTGVTGSSFDPAGLSGSVAVTYIVGTTCPDTLVQNMTVVPNSDPAWTTTAICTTASAISLDSLITGTSGGTWSGTGVTGSTFDPAGLSGSIAVTYTVGTAPCVSTSTQNITVAPLPDPSWTTTSMCSSATVINLDSLITGTSGGAWSGTGVTGNSFDPNGLSGAISITYTAGATGCQATSTQSINVTPAASPAWTTTTVCQSSGILNLNTLITGTTGGTWSGTGVTGSNFDPTGLSGTIAVTYTVGTSPCVSTSTQNITVTPTANAAWTTTSMCADAGAVNLNTLITGTTGGTWSGTGVTGSSFDPTGLSGTIAVTYSVGTAPCGSTSTQNITVTPNADATITSVSALCDNASSINLTAATAGGTWSGTGITNPATGAFNPATATSGTYTITYTVAGACGDTDTVHVTVLPTPNSAWTMPSAICENASAINLSAVTSGGTWSGSGVSGNTFDPSGLSGNITLTYTVTQSGCSSSSTQTINVENVIADFSASPTVGMAPVTVNTNNLSVNAVDYLWNFGDGATSNLTNPSNTYNAFGDYTITLTATSLNGCTDVASVTIHVDQISVLTLPNIFTPNGDGHNDVFLPVLAEGLSEFKATVYDRWGLKMHEWSDVTEGWDGKAKNGKIAPDGTYYYIITGKGYDNKDYELTGFVQLFNE